jgi:hypothetical protein
LDATLAGFQCREVAMRAIKQISPSRIICGLALALAIGGCSDSAVPAFPAAVRIRSSGTHVQREEFLQLSGDVLSPDSTLLPKAAIVWSTSNAKVATVGGTGSVLGVTQGTAIITARSGTASSDITIVVDDEYANVASSIRVSPTPSLVLTGATLQLAADVYNRWRDLLGSAQLAWSSSQVDIATISSSGLVIARAPGVVLLTATSGAVQQSVRLEVASVASMHVTGAVLFVPNSAAQLGAAVAGPAGGVQAFLASNWTSSDTSIFTISPGGYAIARGVGVARVSAMTPVGAVGADLVSRPLPGRLAFLNNGQLFTMTLDGSAPGLLRIAGVPSPRNPMISPDGKRLALDCPGACWVALDAPILKPVMFGRGSEPSWSEDGSKVAVHDDGFTLAILSTVGGPALTYTASRFPVHPRISPDGRHLMYQFPLYDPDDPYAVDDGSADLLVFGDAGSADRLFRSSAQNAAWAPNGQDLAFDTLDGLCISSFPTGRCTFIITHSGGAQPAWSPDGDFLVFATNDALWLADNRGGNVVQLLLPGSAFVTDPSWGARP